MSAQHRQILGYILLALSTISWGMGVALAVMENLSVQMASIVGGLIIAGEVLFVAAVAMLGKDLYAKFKSFFVRS